MKQLAATSARKCSRCPSDDGTSEEAEDIMTGKDLLGLAILRMLMECTVECLCSRCTIELCIGRDTSV
jgi:hypothetical protein